MSPPDIHEIDKTLTAHLAECKAQNRALWAEVKQLKMVVWTAAVGSWGVLLAIVGLLLKNHLHL